MSAIGGEHEAAFIDSFVEKSRRDRYQGLRVSKRRKWLDCLNHKVENELLTRFVVSESYARETMAKDGVVDCWLFADSSELDQTRLSLPNALDEIRYSEFGVIGSFIIGKLACFRAELAQEIVWLARER